MLKQLNISHLILIDEASLSFESGFNAITGETGSGKSAIMHSLHLILGERIDSSIIRKGYEKGSVEAIFDIDNLPEIKHLLEKGGVNHNDEEELIIRREVMANGKSRAFINNQQVQLACLKLIAKPLIHIVSQHANQHLQEVENHRHIINVFGGLQGLNKKVKYSWETLNTIRKELDILIRNETQRVREIEICRIEIEEISQANLKEGEEETLFSEFTLLNNAEERASKAQEFLQLFSNEKQPLLPALNRLKIVLEQLTRIDSELKEAEKSYHSAILELQEVIYTVRNYQNRIEFNPSRMAKVDERLTQINKLKRKYGNSVCEIHAYQKSREEKLLQLENADIQIETLKSQLEKEELHCDQLCQELTLKRKKAAHELGLKIAEQLHQLNMAKAEFFIKVEQQKRTVNGDDRIEFFLLPNVGEHLIPIRECASGGELSRVMLAIHSVLAGREQMPTIVFDEIDSNIGGQTAVIIGEKLHDIGLKHQVLCITHFPQVAIQAGHHLQISKREKDGRTVTDVQCLDAETRREELARMQGIRA